MSQLGIDIGGGSVKVVLLDHGQVAWSGQSFTYSKPDGGQLIAAIIDAIAGRIRPGEAVVGGLCAPGVLDLSRRIIAKAVNVPGLTEMTLDELVRKAVGPAATLNWIGSDAVAAAFDATFAQNLAGRVFSLAIGTGVGAAVLDDGKPLLVSGHSPGHWGQVDVSLPDEEVIGPDGGAGGLEGYIGSAALRKRFGTDDIAEAVANMTADAAPVRALVRAIRIGHAIYRPEHVLLLGGIGIHLAHLSRKIQEEVNRNLTSVARSEWTLNFGKDTWHAARGAALLAR